MCLAFRAERHEGARFGGGTVIALRRGMALFWEASRSQQPNAKPAPLSPLAIALLLKLQAESTK